MAKASAQVTTNAPHDHESEAAEVQAADRVEDASLQAQLADHELAELDEPDEERQQGPAYWTHCPGAPTISTDAPPALAQTPSTLTA